MIDKALLPYLHCFWQVAKWGSFTRAAESLNVGQSAVSYQVKLLEERLGKRLIDRQRRSALRLTPAGQILAARCDEWFEDLRQTLDAMAGLSFSGQLTIAGPTCFGTVVLCDVAQLLRERYPSLKVHLRLGDEHVDLSKEGIDLAVRTISYEQGENAQPLLKAGISLVASLDYAQSKGLPKVVNDLHQHNMIFQSPRDPDWESLREQVPEVPILVDKVTYIDNAQAQLQAVRNGMGLSYLPQYMIEEEVLRGELVEVLPECLGSAHIVLYLCSPYQATDDLKVEATMAAIKEVLAKSSFADVFEWLGPRGNAEP
jgi:DNA-binding transcriptional LysR family regulator